MASAAHRDNRMGWHALAWLGRLIVAFFFVYAGWIKIGDPAGFAKDIRGYEVFPELATNAMAYIIPGSRSSRSPCCSPGYGAARPGY